MSEKIDLPHSETSLNSPASSSPSFETMAKDMPTFEEHIKNLSETQLDAATFSEIIEAINATDVDVPDTLNSTNPNAKDEFLEDPSLTTPNNTHNNLHIDKARRNVETLKNLSSAIESSPNMSDKEKRIAHAALQACLLKNEFLLANAQYNDNPTPENATIHKETNEALYGIPDRDVFLSLVWEKLDKIDSRELSDEEQQEYIELKEMLGTLDRPSQPRFIPKQETIDAFSEMAHTYMSPIFEHIPEDKNEFTPEETAEIIKEALSDFIPDSSEWQVIVEPNRTNINVNQNEKIIRLAGKRAKGNLNRAGLKKIIAHEVGTHFMRALPYEDSSISMFRTGMPDYEAFEEGVAKAMEQSISGKYEDSGISHYISIGLANFLKTDFRTAFEIQKRLSHLSTGKDNSSVLYNSVQRAFRGTDVLPNNKDLVYYNGAEKAWKFIEEHIDDPALFDKLFLSGKTDATNQEHERINYEAKVNGIAESTD